MAVVDPLARLNFFNGQRLEASDLRTEQAYHVEVRRQLTRALFTSGIAAGLEVTKSPTNNYAVTVSAGVAIDALGREIILLEPREVLVAGAPSPLDGVAFGNFVVIEYGEELTAPALSGCTPRGATPGHGAPSRILHDPRIVFLDRWPSQDSARIVLAQVELAKNCEVSRINTGVRRYVSAATRPSHTISLEGEKDIDIRNKKLLRFHIHGDYPRLAHLYIQCTTFSTLHYTEVGGHIHGIDVEIGSPEAIAAHSHTLGELKTDEQDLPNAEAVAKAGLGGIDASLGLGINIVSGSTSPSGIQLQEDFNLSEHVAFVLDKTMHRHGIHATQRTGSDGSIDGDALKPKVNVNIHKAGVSDIDMRAGAALAYLNELHVFYDGEANITDRILRQLNSRPGQSGRWNVLGDRTADHPLVTEGTGAIDLIELGLDLSPGKHELEFAVEGEGNGGQIQYNLYIA